MRGERIVVQTSQGDMPAYLAVPDGAGRRPAVLICMEAFGLVPSIESVARRFAAEGYVALVPDLFHHDLPDDTAGYDDIPFGMELMGRFVARGDAWKADVRAALDFLDAHPRVVPGRIGVTGFCLGGAVAFWTAYEFPDRVAAAAPFYGARIVDHLPRAGRIACPLYLFFGGADPFIPLQEVREIETGLVALGKDVRVKVYAGADHGFFNDARPEVYAPAAAADAWREVTRFFATHLRAGD